EHLNKTVIILVTIILVITLSSRKVPGNSFCVLRTSLCYLSQMPVVQKLDKGRLCILHTQSFPFSVCNHSVCLCVCVCVCVLFSDWSVCFIYFYTVCVCVCVCVCNGIHGHERCDFAL